MTIKLQAEPIGWNHFLIDYYNFSKSEYAKGKTILLQKTLKNRIEKWCASGAPLKHDGQGYPSIDPVEITNGLTFSKLVDIPLEDVDRGRVIWVACATQFGIACDSSEGRHVLEHMDTIAVVSFSALSGTYGAISVWDISLDRVWPMSGASTLITYKDGKASKRPAWLINR